MGDDHLVTKRWQDDPLVSKLCPFKSSDVVQIKLKVSCRLLEFPTKQVIPRQASELLEHPFPKAGKAEHGRVVSMAYTMTRLCCPGPRSPQWFYVRCLPVLLRSHINHAGPRDIWP